jgi:GT2 family glycosyltransferase
VRAVLSAFLPLPGGLSECLDNQQAPLAVRLVDVESSMDTVRLPPSRTGEPYRRLLVLLRQGGYPLGWIGLPVSPIGEVSLTVLTDAFGPSAGAPAAVTDRRGAPGRESMSVPTREPLLSVVVATCANTRLAVGCVEAIQSGATGPYEVIVVENRPALSTVERALAERFGGDQRIRYVEEPRPGLACARNAGLRVARGELVAFTDDDVLVDPSWAPAVRAAFAAMPNVDCVTGLILPLEFETPAQLLVERFASFGKGFLPRIYLLEEPPPDQPLFPYTAGYFGSGANMAFRTEVLRALGGFDPVLGTGTPARGGEDLDVCIRLLQSGRRLAYEPRAIIWHRHPDTHAHLRRRAFDYGAALGAMFTKQIVKGPNRRAILARVPKGIRYYTDPESRKNAGRGPVFPRRLTRLERLGLLYGPIAYLASRRLASKSSVGMAMSQSRVPACPEEPPALGCSSPVAANAKTRWLGDPRQCLIADCLLLVIAFAAVAACLLDTRSTVRLLLVLAAACLIPGAALLTRLPPVEDLLDAAGLAVSLGFSIEAVGALAMLWTGWWHPFVWALALVSTACVLLALDVRRNLSTIKGFL